MSATKSPKSPARRRFLIAGALVGGGLVIGYGLRTPDRLARVAGFAKGDKQFALNAWIKVSPDNTVTVAMAHQEMGQGIHSGLCQLVAEEMDADWAQMRAEEAPIDKVYANTIILADGLPLHPEDHGTIANSLRWVGLKAGEGLGLLATGASTSTRNMWEPLRLAGASAREMLVAVAAKRWNVPAAECATAAGKVLHKASGKSASYGELAADAAVMEPPRTPRLKERKDYALIGKPARRLDLRAKVDGSAVFGVDVRLPGMLHAAIKQCPVFAGTLASHDAAKIKGLPGVVAVVPLADAVAVVADSHWHAQKALAALPVTWNEGPVAAVDSKAIFTQYANDLATAKATKFHAVGDAEAALAGAAKTVEAQYQVPFLAHATMEPMNCTAQLKDGRCEVWAPNQAPSLVRLAAARAAGLDSEQVTVHTTYLGGGFGRRVETDYVTQAVSIAKAVAGKPVQLLWSREEDMQHDMYRPAAIAKFRGGLDAAGKPLAWWNRIVGPSVTRSFVDRAMPGGGSDFPPDKTNAEGAADLPYEFAAQRIEHVLSKVPVPLGYWRSVGHSYNAFFSESFMDELAHAAGKDPYAFRRDLLQAHPRFLKVLETAATKAGWGTPLPAGQGRGIALHESFHSIVAQVAEVAVSPEGEIRVLRVVCAIDCGLAVNPNAVAAQMESGIVFGLSAALYGEITLAKGRVAQSNFTDYKVLQLAQTPRIETHIVDSGAALGGVGEPGTPPIAPAVANAVFAATGKRLRRLPLRREDLRPA